MVISVLMVVVVAVLQFYTAPVLSVLVPPISVSGGDQSRQSRAECLANERERERRPGKKRSGGGLRGRRCGGSHCVLGPLCPRQEIK